MRVQIVGFSGKKEPRKAKLPGAVFKGGPAFETVIRLFAGE